MKTSVFYMAGQDNALDYAKAELVRNGILFSENPNAVTHLLLGAPAFSADGRIKGGGYLSDLLPLFHKDIHILGGNLSCPALKNYHTTDFLKDPIYLAENADITAHCAIKVALRTLPCTWKGCPVLVIGWGRIGKCLARLLRNLDARVSVALRNPADRSILETLGYDTLDSTDLGYELGRYRVIFNTVPSMVISEETATHCRADCLKIELASQSGIAGEDVVSARGLPCKEAPETSGALIAKSVLRRYQEGAGT